MSTIKVNYKSDLPPMSVELTLGGEVQQIPEHDFVLRFFTVYPHRHYDCVFEDGVWTNMEKVDDTHLNVYITNHGLGVGQLHCLYISKAPYEGYNPAYYTTYSLTGMDVELIDGNGDATDGIDAEIAIDIEGVLADCRAATAAALEITALMQEIYDRLVDFYPDNYYTKTESDARFHPLYGKRTLNMNADNMYLNRLNMINAEGGEDAYLTNHTSRGNKILVGNGRKVTELPWPTNDETWTVALTKDHYSKSAMDSLLGAKQDTLASGTNIKTVGGESLLPSSSTNTNVKPQYIFEATVTDGVVTCSETWESLWEMIFTKGKSVAAKVGTRIYTLHNTSGVTIVFKNLSENTIRTLTCGSMSSPTWSFSSRNLQDELVSGSNIKTINNQSLLGSGNINISGGGGSGVVYVTVTGTSSNLSADKTFSEVVGLLNDGNEVVYVYSGAYYRVTSYDVNHISAVVVDGEYIRYLTHTSTEHVGTLLLGVIGDALMDTIDDLLAAKQDKSMLVNVTENSGTFTADKTFAEVDAAVLAGQLVRFFDGTNYFDVTGYIATMVVVASYTTGATNEKFTYTPSGLTWERTLLAPKDSPAFTGTPTAPTASVGTNTTQIATTEFVQSAINNLPSPMVFKGSLGTDGTITSLPTDGSATVGDTYKVITAGTYAGASADVGDAFICKTKTSNANTWELIPSGDEPSGTVTSVGVSVPTGLTVSNTPITSSGTIAISYDTDYSIPTNTKQTSWDNKQDALVSGTNIKTVNSNSIIGSGNVSVGTITSVKMNGTTVSSSGEANLGTVITSETQLSKGTTSGNGNAVTDISVNGHQITLTKGKTFLESYTETDPVFTASVAHGITSSDIANWNSKTSNVGTITGITMNGASKGTSGVVDLGTVITEHQDISGKVDKETGKGLSSNDYTDAEKTKLSGIATGAEVNVQSDWNQTTTTADDYIKNKPSLATVATSGSYSDLSNKPTIPTVNNATLTIQKNGTTVGTFTANASSNVTANISVPTKVSDLTNDSGFITGYTETDPTVPSWAKQSTKPTYNGSEIKYTGTTGNVVTNNTTLNVAIKAIDDAIGNVETLLSNI